jgi:hypothetical protein
METVNQVYETTDYSRFKNLPGNRSINKQHVLRLVESFKTSYLMSPIIINEKSEIIDGQHRFLAAKELNLPIRFIVCNEYDLKQVQSLNTNSKNWRKEDYLKAYCDLNYPDYIKFRSFMYQYPEFGINACEVLLTDTASGSKLALSNKKLISETNKEGKYTARYFEEGKLKIKDYKKAQANAEKLLTVKPFYEGYNRLTFVRAMIGIFKIADYNHAQFLERLRSNPGMLTDCANVGHYKLLIEDIYNRRSREKISLRY